MKSKQENKMNVQFSVFNQHVNKAELRAKKVMRDNFPMMYREIRKVEKEGIMSIFNQDPTNATLVYSALVTAFVNKY